MWLHLLVGHKQTSLRGRSADDMQKTIDFFFSHFNYADEREFHYTCNNTPLVVQVYEPRHSKSFRSFAGWLN